MKLGGGWLAALLLAAAGCYDPGIQNGGLVCAANGECPSGYQCADNHCWLEGTGPAAEDGGGDGGTGGDQGGDAGDMTPGIAPAAPTGLMTVPAGPAQTLQPLVKGNAPAGTTVKVYANAACTGTVVATGDASAFASGLMVSPLSANATTQLAATATDPGTSLTSACSSPVSYQHDSTAPAAPVLTGTLPPSPSASDVMPFVLGTAEAGSTINVYTGTCGGTPAATGTAADLMGNGIQITVAMGTTTNIFATATDAAGNVSPCSTPALAYLEDPTLPPAPTNLATNPASPSKSVTTFKLTGTSGANTTVTVYTTSNCSGAPVTSGTAAAFASPGFNITVSANSINNFYANATSAANRVGPCSAQIKYIEDELAPNTGAAQVRDGAAADIHWQKVTDVMDANWLGFADAASGILSYDYNLSSSTACAGDILATTNLGMVTSQHTASLALVDGTTYYNCVRAYDGAGNVTAFVASNGVTVDATVPTVGSVKDGTGADITWSGSSAAIDANWSGFGDGSGSGLASFDYNLSTTPSCTGDVVPVVSFPSSSLTAHLGGLALSSGVIYYSCVRAYDQAGNLTAWVPSNGVTVDLVPPSTAAANVIDGSTGPDAQYQSSLTSTNMRWSGFSDAGGSGIVNYDWGLSTASDCSTFVTNVSGVGVSGAFNPTGLTLTNGQKYYNCIRALDVVGNPSAWEPSDGVTADNQAPTTAGAVVHDGTSFPPDLTYQKSTTQLTANWSGFSDNTGVASYVYNVSLSTACNAEVVGATGTNATSVTINHALTSGTTYFVCVLAIDLAGNPSAQVHSDGVTVDTGAPVAGTVRDGAGTDIQFQSSTTSMIANWLGFSDALSGIVGYNYALSTATDCSAPLVTMSIATTSGSGSVPVGAALVNGTRYYNCVQAIDAAGNTGSFVRSDGVVIDTDKPAGGMVKDGTSGVDATFSASSTQMGATWSGFGDGGSGIVSYDWQLTTTSNCSGAPVGQMIGLPGTSTLATGLTLTNDTLYYNCVRAVDAVGNVGDWVPSNGVRTDFVAPRTASAQVQDGTIVPGDITWSNQTHGGGSNWMGFTEPGSESGIVSYDYNLSTTTSCTGDVVPPTNVGNVTQYSWNNAAITLLVGSQVYYSCVRATDAAGNVSGWVVSNGFHIDTSAPLFGTVNDGPTVGVDAAWSNSTSLMSASWNGFIDDFSGIQFYDWGLSTSSTCATIDRGGPNQLSGATQSVSNVAVALTDGNIYYNCVRATDFANNVSQWKPSNGIRVDTSKPTGGSVADGLAADITWTNNTSSVSANWTGFTDGAGTITNYDWGLATDATCTSFLSTLTGVFSLSTTKTFALTSGQTYFNCVRANDAAGNHSNYVASNGFTVDTTPPSQPGALTVTSGNGQVILNWGAATDTGGSGIDFYDVLQCTNAGCTPVAVVATSSSLTITLSLANCTFDGFAVRAHDVVGNVGPVTATVYGLPTLPPPASLTVVPGAGRFEYNIAAVPGAVNYQICWSASANPCGTGQQQTGRFSSGFIDTAGLNTQFYAAHAIDGASCNSSQVNATAPLFNLTSAQNTLGTFANQWLGYSVAMVGDMNQDGDDDFAVSWGFGGAGNHASSVEVHSGSSPTTTLWSATGGFGGGAGKPFDYFGSSMGTGGDVDGDGGMDLLVGAPSYAPDFSTANNGQWYLYSSTGALLCTSAVGAQGSLLGGTLAIIPDVNGDGKADMLVSAKGGNNTVGKVSVYSYSAGTCNLVYDIVDPLNDLFGNFGIGTASIGDYNNDGVADFAITEIRTNPNTPVAYLYSGLNGAQITQITPPAGTSFKGMVSGVGDVDGDGKIDLIANLNNGLLGGAVVYSGKDLHVIYNLTGFNTNPGSNDGFGARVGAAGDLNGDGFSDFFVTADATKVGANTNVGTVYLFGGGATTPPPLLYQVNGAGPSIFLGDAVAGGGDTNGDGRPDLVFGAYAYACAGAGSNCGEWWLYSPNAELRWAPHGEYANPRLFDGYVGLQTPVITAPGTIGFTGQGGTGPYTFSQPTNNTGGTLGGAGLYTPGPALNVLDTIRVTDSLNRSFDTRVWARSSAGSPKPAGIGRPFNLRVTGTGSGTVSLAWNAPPVNPPNLPQVLEYRTGGGAWTPVAVAGGTLTYTYNGPASQQVRFRVKFVKSGAGALDSMWSNEVTSAPLP